MFNIDFCKLGKPATKDLAVVNLKNGCKSRELAI